MSQLENINSAHATLNKMLTAESANIVYLSFKKNVGLETNKAEDFLWLTEKGVVMPDSQPWTSPRHLIDLIVDHRPCVVKQNTAITLGIQTTVVKHTHDIAQVIKSIQHTGSKSGLVQRFISGQEFTVTVLVGSHNWRLVGIARDYKKQFDDNQGLNTFGLGSYCLSNDLEPELVQQLNLIVNCYRARYSYRGFLSCQFITDQTNRSWLMECNTRICDPEFQSMAPNLPSNFETCVLQALEDRWVDDILLGNKNAVTVVLAHQNWPTPQASKIKIDFSDCPFDIVVNHGTWDQNLYHASITNSGTDLPGVLAARLYSYLAQKTVNPYRYRTDIAK